MKRPKQHLRHIQKKQNTPKPLNISKYRPTSRYIQPSPAGLHSCSVPAHGDADRFARDAEHMNSLLEKVNGIGNLFHLELEGRLRANQFDASDHFNQVSNHLATFNWKTPPASPTLMSDGSTRGPDSPGTSRKTRELQKSLQNKALEELMAGDKKYHGLERNLVGLKEWWTANRVDWKRQRDLVERTKLFMEGLQIQRQNANGDVARAQKDFAYQKQYKELKNQLSWFDERIRLMKAVKDQCKNIQGDILQEEKMAERLLVKREWSNPLGFSFTISADVKADVRKAPWWSKLGRGFPWWLQIAHDFMEWNVSDLQGLLDDYLEEKFKCDQKLEEENKFSRECKKKGRGDSAAAVIDLVAVLDMKRTQLDFAIIDITRRIEHHATYLESLKVLLSMRGPWYASPNMKGFVNNVHLIFYLLLHEMEIHRRFIEASEDEALSLDESLEVLTRMEDHFVLNENYNDTNKYIRGNNIIKDIQKIRNMGEDGLVAGVSLLELIIENYERIVTEVEELVAHNKAIQQKNFELQDIRQDSPTLAEDASSGDVVWGGVKTIERAYKLLRTDNLRGIDGNRYSTRDLLRWFFISPDIAPSFQGLRPISGLEFVKLVNSFLEEPFDAETLQAFVFYCEHEAQELFYTSRGKVCGDKTNGWERVEEMGIRGPPRKVLLRKPPKLHDLSHWMVHNQKKFVRRTRDGLYTRDASEKHIYETLKQYYPSPINLTLENVQEYLSYFSQSGLFYKYASKSGPNGQPVLIRIDSGWHFQPRDAFPHLFDNQSPPAYFWAIRKAYGSKEGQDRVNAAYRRNPMMTDSDLYEALRPALMRIRPTVGENRFHLWLRWCDQNHDLFQLYRNGQLDFIDPACV